MMSPRTGAPPGLKGLANMPLTREQITQQTSQKLADAAPKLKRTKAVIGLDGFVDEIIAVVDRRHDEEWYEPVKTIAAFADKVRNSAGQSNNFELVVKRMKLGGNGPIMANAMAAAGVDVTYVGNLGFPQLHPVFNELAQRARVHSIAEPGHTDALEFEDGKLMLGKHQALKDVNWRNLMDRVGLQPLTQMITESKLVAVLNWTMLPYLGDIWQKLLTEVFPLLPKAEPGSPERKLFFVDLCDPEKRTAEDLRAAMRQLTQVQQFADVILGLNLKEATQVAQVMGLPASADAEAAIEASARAIRERLGLATVVIHPRRGAAAATATESAKFQGPFVQQPKISTGAGDHFNAGFATGRVLGLSLEEALCVGVGISGYYVRTAISPSAQQLAEFIERMPPPEA
jgi:sugar/nucleoside kinase (ribokinase family)